MSDIMATQALAILETLQALPRGSRIDISHCTLGGWHVHCVTPQGDGSPFADSAEHTGEDLTDALGQLTTVLKLNSESGTP